MKELSVLVRIVELLDVHLMAGNYERETAEMLILAFKYGKIKNEVEK